MYCYRIQNQILLNPVQLIVYLCGIFCILSLHRSCLNEKKSGFACQDYGSFNLKKSVGSLIFVKY